MKNNNNNHNQNTLTLKKVLSENKIRIPIIQRDYVQGLDSEPFKNKRDRFLDYLLDSKEKKTLDFIYGYIENGYFVPIDGQQRLTTLFLLHLFLGVEDFKKENFTYELRTSAKDFFSNLIKINFKELIKKFEECQEERLQQENQQQVKDKNKQAVAIKFSDCIKEQSWFHLHWERDTTVVAVLDMLDAIREKIKDKEIKNIEGINFHFYPLNNFTNPEQLFIKLNARGLLLTPFEQFKNWLIKKTQELNLKDTDWQTKLDTAWYEMFWKLARQIKNEKEELAELAELTDRIFLRFFNELLLFYYLIYSKDKKEKKEEVIDFLIGNRELKFYLSHYEHIFDTFQSDKEKILNDIFKFLDKFYNSKENKETDNKLNFKQVECKEQSQTCITIPPTTSSEVNNDEEKFEIEKNFKEFVNGYNYNERKRLLFLVFYYSVVKEIEETEIFKIIRVFRNLLYNINLGKEDFGSLYKFINEIIESFKINKNKIFISFGHKIIS